MKRLAKKVIKRNVLIPVGNGKAIHIPKSEIKKAIRPMKYELGFDGIYTLKKQFEKFRKSKWPDLEMELDRYLILAGPNEEMISVSGPIDQAIDFFKMLSMIETKRTRVFDRDLYLSGGLPITQDTKIRHVAVGKKTK